MKSKAKNHVFGNLNRRILWSWKISKEFGFDICIMEAIQLPQEFRVQHFPFVYGSSGQSFRLYGEQETYKIQC